MASSNSTDLAKLLESVSVTDSSGSAAEEALSHTQKTDITTTSTVGNTPSDSQTKESLLRSVQKGETKTHQEVPRLRPKARTITWTNIYNI